MTFKKTDTRAGSNAKPVVVTPKKIPAQPISVEKQYFTSAKIVTLMFNSDHKLLKNNGSDWTNSGTVFSKPEFTRGENDKAAISHPISHNRNEHVEVTVTFEVKPVKPDNHLTIRATITGDAPWGDFKRTIPNLKAGTNTVTITSTEKLPNRITTLVGNISWKIKYEWDGEHTLEAGDSEKHIIFVTWAHPMALGKDEVTLKRMSTATTWVNQLKDNPNPHEIASEIMNRFRWPATRPSPKLAKYHHPKYDNGAVGAWPMSEHPNESGESQAIVRLTHAMLQQLGVPGSELKMVWASPNRESGGKPFEDDLELEAGSLFNMKRQENFSRQVARLVRKPVIVAGNGGVTYFPNKPDLAANDDTTNPGLHAYMACLKLTVGRTAKYYAGGEGGASFNSPEDVLKQFWGLIWVSVGMNGSYYVNEVVKEY